MTETYPDVEGGCRTWLRTLPAVTSVVDQRVWFAVPDDADEDDYPLVLVQRVGGGDDPSEAVVDQCMLQLTVVGARRGKAVAAALALTLRAELKAIRAATAWGSDVVCHRASVESMIPTIDPGDSRPRYNLTVMTVATSGSLSGDTYLVTETPDYLVL